MRSHIDSEALQKSGLFATLSPLVYPETTAHCKNATLSQPALGDATRGDRRGRSETGLPERRLLADHRPTRGAGCPEPTGKHGGLWAARRWVAIFAAVPGRLGASVTGGSEGFPVRSRVPVTGPERASVASVSRDAAAWMPSKSNKIKKL
jgi:hypothetical protein